MGSSERLDHLLIAWHRSLDRMGSGLGYPSECPSCRGYRSSRHWHGTDVDEDGQVYLDTPDPLIAGTGSFVGRLIEQLEQAHQMALAYEARALAIGNYAFRNPRLPSDPQRLSLLISEARGALAIMLGDYLLSQDD